MEKPKSRNGLAGHPQLPKIIDAILAGKSCREIATWTRPRVSYATISRYARNTVKPTLEQAKQVVAPQSPNRMGNQAVIAPATHEEVLQQVTKQVIVSAPVLASRQN